MSSSARAPALGDEYGAVVDAAGTQTSLDDAVARVRPGGTVVVVATYWEPVTIDAGLLTKEVRIVPSAMYGHVGHDHGGASEFEAAAALLADAARGGRRAGAPPVRPRRRARGVPGRR